MTGLKNIIRSMKGNRSLYSSLILQLIIVLISLSIITAELVHLPRESTVDSIKPETDNNQVTNYDECKKYLCKYGYLNCDCEVELMRKRRDLPPNMLPTEYGIEDDVIVTPKTNSSNTTTPIPATCNEQDFANGLRTLQKNYRLDITGVCDTRTTAQMSKRRCGQPDNVIDKLDSEEEPDIDRYSRSLSSILTRDSKLQQSVVRRKRQLADYIEEIDNEQATPKRSKSERVERSVLSAQVVSDDGGYLTKSRVSWRLMSDHYSHIIPPNAQRGILKQAFRYWSEVSPLCFYEDKDSDTKVDIEIGFLEGVHLSCYRQFDGYGGEIAHKYFRDVHFDNSEPYTTELLTTDNRTRTRISLLSVAVHELGHVIGLNHSNMEDSVMNAIYHQSIRGVFELSHHDRREVQKAYGPCTGSFDMVFDWVRSRPGTKNSRIFNSYFFRGDHFWMYENNNQKARIGDPLLITPEWGGLPPNLDAFLHYWKFSLNTLTFTDEYYFFKGEHYYIYNAADDRPSYGGLIRSKFQSHNSTSPKIPVNLDTVFYDWRSNVELIYFFKGDQVYKYDYSSEGTHSCCVNQTSIESAFPPASPSDLYSPSGNTYTRDIDSLFYSHHHQSMYIIKGDDLWKNELWSQTSSTNSMKYVGKWYNLWPFICDGECS